MNDARDEDLHRLAEKINDGITEVLPSQPSPGDARLDALDRIHRISQRFREHIDVQRVVMQKGDQWGHLSIRQKIGEGGIGEVYRAHDPMLDCDVAVKFLNRKNRLYIGADQFLLEARNMARVRHPHVLAIQGAMVADDLVGYWSDYLDGEVLSERLLQRPLSRSECLTCARHLCQALKAIHNNGLVHGDIKAPNVMLQPNRGAILLDFGASRRLEQAPADDHVVQVSPMAMAPEQFRGQAPDAASDVYALGLLFWHMCSGVHPLQGQERSGQDDRAVPLQERSRTVQGPRRWRALIARMLEPDPALRPAVGWVEQQLQKLEQSPLIRAKRLAAGSVLALAIGITALTLYSNHKTRQASHEIQAINDVLSNILLKSSPLHEGKDVLLMDVLSEAEAQLFSNTQISKRQKYENLLQLIKTYRQQGRPQKAIELATRLLADADLTSSMRLDLLVQKGAALNDNNNYSESEPLLLEAIQIEPVTAADAKLQISVLINLIYSYNESMRLKEVPPLIAQAKAVWQQGDQNLSSLANIHLVEGNYHEILQDYDTAFEHYLKAVEHFTAHYGPDNLDVLIAKGAAGTVLTYRDETLPQGVQRMEQVVEEMDAYLGPDHSSSLIARVNLADAYKSMGQPEKAIKAIEPRMHLVYQVYGADGGRAMMFKNLLAGFYAEARDIDTADRLQREIIDTQTGKHGLTSDQAIQANLYWGWMLHDAGQPGRALPDLQDVLHTAEAQLPADSRWLLDLQDLVLWLQHRLGDATAMPKLKALLQLKQQHLGEDDPSTQQLRDRLADESS